MKERVLYLDYAKIITAYLVIWGHLTTPACPIRLLIYSFHMPLFFTISGMVSRDVRGADEYKNLVVKIFKRVFVPAIYFLVFFVVFMAPLYHYGVCDLKTDFSIDNGKTIFGTICNMLSYTFVNLVKSGKLCNSPVWFLFVLFYCNVAHPLFANKSLPKMLVLLALVFCIVNFNIRLPFYLEEFLLCYPFYFLGSRFKGSINRITDNCSIWAWVLLIVIFLCLAKFNGRIEILSMMVGKHIAIISLPIFYITAILGSFVVFWVANKIKRSFYTNQIANGLISILGYQGMFIYLYKHVIGYNQSFIFTSISALVIFALCHILHVLTIKFIPTVLGKNK